MQSSADTAGRPLLERLLAARGITEPPAIAAFLDPPAGGFHDPFAMKGMEQAVAVIRDHIDRGSRILVHGDYDVDGITATAIVVTFLRGLGADCQFYIPDRLTEGYGLSESGIEYAVAMACDLVITVDCGISGDEEIAELARRGIDTVVTDHHECKEQLPSAARAVVNPRQPGETYPCLGLAGAGVALKLIHALCLRLGRGESWRHQLAFAALGTMADVMPLTGENRAIVYHGIASMQRQENIGLAAMLRYVNMCNRPVTSSVVGFTLAPRLNAAGRMGDANRAVELLLTGDVAEADALAQALCADNQKRKDVENEIIAEAARMIDEQFDFAGRDVLIVHKEGWHQGIIGIVASRLAEMFCRPAIVLAGEDGVYRGSSRSFGDFDMLGAVSSASSHIIKFGGHRKACGMLIAADQLPAFKRAIHAFASRTLTPENSRHVVHVDLPLDVEEINETNARQLARLAPFGEGNREPVFLTRDLQVRDMRMLGNGHHIKLSLQGEGMERPVAAIGFGMEMFDGLVGAGDRVDVVYALYMNSWNGQETLQLKIRDLRPRELPATPEHTPRIAQAEPAARQRAEPLAAIAARLELELCQLVPQKPEFMATYQYIRANFGQESLLCDLSLLARKISRSYQLDLNWFRLSRILEVFHEAGLLREQVMDVERRHITLLPVEGKAKLSACASFQYVLAAREGC